MEIVEIHAGLRQLQDEDGLKKIFCELCQTPEQYLPLMREILSQAIEHSDTLSDEGVRQELRLAVLFLALQQDHSAVPLLINLLKTAAIDTYFDSEDWLFNELPKLLGRMLEAGKLSLLEDLILDPKLPEILREQLLMTLMFRWMQKADRNSELAVILKELLINKLGGLKNDQLSMAIIILVIAVDGIILKPQIMNFYHACGKGLATIFPEKSLLFFYTLGPEKIKTLLKQNYDASFGEPEKEVERMFHPLEESSSPSELTASGKTIVRESPKISRNDPCPCGSGKKYKKCCGG
ncbi:MAG: SEC-C metal-binding domain-containing protein [Lentisphaeria bacterium]